jgi:hypothetical protein
MVVTFMLPPFYLQAETWVAMEQDADQFLWLNLFGNAGPQSWSQAGNNENNLSPGFSVHSQLLHCLIAVQSIPTKNTYHENFKH